MHAFYFHYQNLRKPIEIYEEMLRSKAGRIETAGVTMTLLTHLERDSRVVASNYHYGLLVDWKHQMQVSSSKTTWYEEGLATMTVVGVQLILLLRVGASQSRGESVSVSLLLQ